MAKITDIRNGILAQMVKVLKVDEYTLLQIAHRLSVVCTKSSKSGDVFSNALEDCKNEYDKESFLTGAAMAMGMFIMCIENDGKRKV